MSGPGATGHVSLGPHHLLGWLGSGPQHQLFTTRHGLLWRFAPTATPAALARMAPALDNVTTWLRAGLPGLPEAAEVPSVAEPASEPAPGGPWFLADATPGVCVDSLTARATTTTARERTRLPPQQALGLARALLEPMEAWHASDVWHGALTPGRMFVTQTGPPRDEPPRLTVWDLGCAAAAVSDPEHPLRPSERHFPDLFPVAELVPPELFDAAGPGLGPASDIFQWAAMVVAWTTGLPAYGHAGQSTMQAYAALRTGRRRHVSDMALGLPATLRGLVDRALSPDPRERPSAAELREALEAAEDVAPPEQALRDALEVGIKTAPPQPWAARFTPKEPGHAPWPPGTSQERQRQELLQRAALSIDTARARREGRPSGATGARRIFGILLVVGLAFAGAQLLEQQRRGRLGPLPTRADADSAQPSGPAGSKGAGPVNEAPPAPDPPPEAAAPPAVAATRGGDDDRGSVPQPTNRRARVDEHRRARASEPAAELPVAPPVLPR